MAKPKEWVCLGKSELINSMFNPIQNMPSSCLLKPMGGIWLSPYTPGKKYVSAWQEWCDGERFRYYEEGTVITISKSARIYYINSQLDLIELFNEVGEYKPFPEKFNFDFWKQLNFEKAAEKYDLIYLTERGQRQTHLPFIENKYNLYTWDCCSAIMLNWVIETQRKIEIQGIMALKFQILKLHDQGLKSKEIAEQIGRSESVISHHLIKMGIRRRGKRMKK